jgi:hypothetical protein
MVKHMIYRCKYHPHSILKEPSGKYETWSTAADMTMWDSNEILQTHKIGILYDNYKVCPYYVSFKVTAFEDSRFS